MLLFRWPMYKEKRNQYSWYNYTCNPSTTKCINVCLVQLHVYVWYNYMCTHVYIGCKKQTACPKFVLKNYVSYYMKNLSLEKCVCLPSYLPRRAFKQTYTQLTCTLVLKIRDTVHVHKIDSQFTQRCI